MTYRLVAGLLACFGALMCSSCGPRMRVQPSIQPYETRMPDMPAGSVPSRGRPAAVVLEQSRQAQNPLPSTPQNIQRGRTYYNYYCVMCHGDDGRGNGPVGISYVPKPTDLTSAAIAGLSDGELYRRMLIGTGHSPVLEQTVLPGQRWPIVLYVRSWSLAQ